MEFIHQNPFRVLGLPVTASEREISKRVSDLEMYLEMGKTVHYDMDFPALSPIDRSLESVNQAVNQIESDKSRLYYSFFWFLNNNTTDELALEVLKDGRIDTAIRLMEKQITNENGDKKSFSTAKNLSLIYMALSLKNKSFNSDNFINGLKLQSIIYNDDYFSIFSKITPERLSLIDKKTILEQFIEDIHKNISPFLDKENGVSLKQLFKSFSLFSNETKKLVEKKFILVHIQAIENAIEVCIKERTINQKNANSAATNLWKSIKIPLSSIQDAVGKEDYGFQAISENLANEFENCSTSYYNYHFNNETGIDPGETALKISKFARTLATSIATQRRIDEGIEIIEKWIEGKEDREKQKNVEPSFDFIVKEFNNLPDPDDADSENCLILLQHSKYLIEKCKPHLEKIKSELGPNNDTFVSISSAVASHAMNMCIAYANIKKDSKKTLEIFRMIALLSMDYETSDRYSRNKSIFEANVNCENYINSITSAIDKAYKTDIKGLKSAGLFPIVIKELIESTTPNLKKFKLLDYKLYISLSSAVANAAMNICVDFSNQNTFPIAPLILMVFCTIEELDMDEKTLYRYNENKNIISSNARAIASNQYNETTNHSNSRAKSNNQCYIATMVYGDHNSPEVVILRRFRDDVLYKSSVGTFLVKIYYMFSPSFVKHCKNYTFLHRPIKYFLDRIVRRIA